MKQNNNTTVFNSEEVYIAPDVQKELDEYGYFVISWYEIFEEEDNYCESLGACLDEMPMHASKLSVQKANYDDSYYSMPSRMRCKPMRNWKKYRSTQYKLSSVFRYQNS